MSITDFDKYAQDYEKILQRNLRHFGNIEYFAECKINILKNKIKKKPRRILEFGCGTGSNLKHLGNKFPESEIWGCDISRKSLESAARENPTVKLFLTGEENEIIHNFDLIFIANVFHHIALEQRDQIMNRITDFLADHGEVFIFEHNPYNPVTRHLVRICPFDKDAILLNPKGMKKLIVKCGLGIYAKKYMLFFPALLRHLRFLEEYLGYIPLGGQYYFHAFKQISAKNNERIN
jgi:SAM-dependent methyltransferase